MQLVTKYGLYESDRISFLPVENIIPNPEQPRKYFDPQALRELADSISRYGVLQPLTVRHRWRKYELVAGERRLRAAKLAGLAKVPCILLDIDIEDATLVTLVENLQRRDLNYIEEAQGLAHLIQTFNMSQDETARRIGKSQSSVANKLRLLKLPQDIQETLRKEGLTERHARALLRLGCNNDRREVLGHIVKECLTVAKTEEYIDWFLSGQKEVQPAPVPVPQSPKKNVKPLYVIKDIRLFLNTVDRGMNMMKQSGINANYGKDETDTDIVLTIKIPKSSVPLVTSAGEPKACRE